MELANAKPKAASKHTRRQVPSRIIEGTEARVELLGVVYQAAGQARGGKGKPSQPRAEPLSSGAGRQKSAILFIAPCI